MYCTTNPNVISIQQKLSMENLCREHVKIQSKIIHVHESWTTILTKNPKLRQNALQSGLQCLIYICESVDIITKDLANVISEKNTVKYDSDSGEKSFNITSAELKTILNKGTILSINEQPIALYMEMNISKYLHKELDDVNTSITLFAMKVYNLLQSMLVTDTSGSVELLNDILFELVKEADIDQLNHYTDTYTKRPTSFTDFLPNSIRHNIYYTGFWSLYGSHDHVMPKGFMYMYIYTGSPKEFYKYIEEYNNNNDNVYVYSSRRNSLPFNYSQKLCIHSIIIIKQKRSSYSSDNNQSQCIVYFPYSVLPVPLLKDQNLPNIYNLFFGLYGYFSKDISDQKTSNTIKLDMMLRGCILKNIIRVVNEYKEHIDIPDIIKVYGAPSNMNSMRQKKHTKISIKEPKVTGSSFHNNPFEGLLPDKEDLLDIIQDA